MLKNNVATSRAKQLPIIVAVQSIINASCHKDVRILLELPLVVCNVVHLRD